MSITLDNNERIVEQENVAQHFTEAQEVDQRIQEVANPVITTLSEKTTESETLPTVTTIDAAALASTAEQSEEEISEPEALPVDTTTDVTSVAQAEDAVKVEEKTVEKVTTVAKDNRIVLYVHKNGHPKKHGNKGYSLKSVNGHHYLNREGNHWFRTDSKGRKHNVSNFNELYRIADEYHVRLANEKKV